MQPRRKNKFNSLWIRLLLPMMALNIALAFIFYGTIYVGGTIRELEKNAVDILGGTVSGRAGYLQQQMNSVWANFDENLREIESTVLQTLNVYDRDTFDTANYEQLSPVSAQGRNSVSDIGANYEGDGKDYLSEYLLKSLTPGLVKLMRQNYVNGAYVILEGNPDSVQKEGLYFRRTSTSTSTFMQSDLMLLVAPSRATVDYCSDFGTRTNNMDRFFFDDARGFSLRDIYRKVFSTAEAAAREAASGGTGVVNERFSKNYAYWAPCYNFINIPYEVISYNVPLLQNGKVYGMIGVDIAASHITSLLNPSEIMGGSSNGSYVLSVREKSDETLHRLLNSGILYNKLYSTQKEIGILENVGGSCYRLEDGTSYKTTVYASVTQLTLYNNNTPYESMVWELAAVVEKDELFGFSANLNFTLLRSLLISIAVSLAAVFAVSLYLSRPVKKLAAEVRNNHSLHKSLSSRTNIREIDELVSEIQNLAADVADSASKLEQIIQVADVPIGAFEEREGSDKIFHTGKFFALLGIPAENEESGYMNKNEFYARLQTAADNIHQKSSGGAETLYRIKERWVRLNLTQSAGRTLGVVSDITQEVNEKEKLEYDRDHDLLTQLLNRRAFYERAEALFSTPEVLKTAAVVMLDLDNLKYINDNFGHETGDRYIAGMAEILKRRKKENFLVSRLSGDEFAALYYGAENREQIRSQIALLTEDLKKSEFVLDGSQKIPIRASAGIAWYPEHSDSVYELLRKADIAMYKAKHTQKSTAMEFEE